MTTKPLPAELEDKKLAEDFALIDANINTYRLTPAQIAERAFLSGLAKRDEQYRELVEAVKYAEEFFVVSMPYFNDEIMKQDAKESLEKLRKALKTFTGETER